MKEERILYLECNSGISGDMTVGALLDLGASKERLKKALDSLGVDGYHLHFGRKMKCGIDAFDFDVHLEEDDGPSHGHHHEQSHEHHHEHNHNHENSHEHQEDKKLHAHVHRNLKDIMEIICRLDAGEEVKELANRIFFIVAEAESKAHGVPVEEVHFHEVGAIDSIVDIISTAFCLSDLGISKVIISPLAEGQGYALCQHGVMPVPVPATANIASAYGLRFKFTEHDGEMVTPTGAAIAAALDSKEELPKYYTIKKIGLGAGNKEFKQANILRAMLICPEDKKEEQMLPKSSDLWVLETNLDDCSGEALGFVMDLLLEEGAKDVWYTPAYMKKNRPSYVLHILCEETYRRKMEDTVFSHTTTIGIRRYPVERTVMERCIEEKETSLGSAQIKVCTYEGKKRCYPEYESVRKICREQGLGFMEVYHQIKQETESEKTKK